MAHGPLADHPRIARLFDASTNAYEVIFRSKGRLTPPWRIRRYVGQFNDPREYANSASRQVAGLKAIGALTPATSVLDVGCGTGRLASALAGFLDPGTRYEGLDPQPVPIAWCRENISPRHPNFHFQETRTASPKYNPSGRTLPEEYRFPFDDDQFDLILVLSVLTHVPREVEERLLSESRRVLAREGRIVLTEYLLDEESRSRAAAGRTTPPFPHSLGEDRTETPQSPEGFVARDRAWAESLWRRLALAPEYIHHGNWTGRSRAADSFSTKYGFFQDFVCLSAAETILT